MNRKTINCDLAKLKRYIYRIEFKVIINSVDSKTYQTSSNEVDLTNFLKSFQIYNMFDDFYFPVVKVECVLDPLTHESIIADLKKVKFTFTVKRYNWDDFNSDNDEMDLDNASYTVIFKDIELYVNDYNKNAYSGSEDFQIAWEGSETDGFQSPKYLPLVLELFPIQNLYLPRYIVRGVYRNITRNELLVKMVKEYKNLIFNDKYKTVNPDLKNKSFLVNNSLNDGVIPQVIFPNLNYLQTFNYLQNTYGIYSTGIRIFFDFKRNYILYGDFNEPTIQEKSGADDGAIIEPEGYNTTIHAGDNGSISPENDKIYLVLGKAATEYSGSYYNSNYFIYGQNSFMINFNDISNKELYGEHIKIKRTNILYEDEFETTTYNNYHEFYEGTTLYANDPDSLNKWINDEWEVVNHTKIINDYDFYKSKHNSIDESFNVQSAPRYQFWYNPYSHNGIETELDNYLKKSSIIYTLQFRNIDMDICTPNKKYILKFINETYNQNYDGVYQLRSSLNEFTPVKPGLYECNTSLGLYKLDDDKSEDETLENMVIENSDATSEGGTE
jgi:hypothetical protein